MINRESIQKILIRGTNWIGDSVLASPAITAIGKHFEKAEITLLAKPHVGDLLSRHPFIHHHLHFEDQGKHRGFLGKRKLIHEIKEKSFDMLILFQNSFESALLGFFSKIPIRYGYRTDGRRFLLTHPIPVPRDLLKKHHIYYYLELLKPLNIKSEPSLTLETSKEEDEWADEQLQSLGGSEENIWIGFNPGAAYGTAKRWPMERFSELGRKLVQGYPAKVLLFGTQEEEILGKKIAEGIPGKAVVLNGKTTLRQLMALLKKCDLLVTNDSGPMHVAMGLKVPVVAIFGSTDPKTTGPFGRAGIVVKREVVCSPCQLRVCPIDHRCMEWVTVGEVFTAAAKCLEETGFPRWKTSVKNESSVGAKGKQVTEVAVFLDRDGTLNKDVGYVDRRERMAFYPRSIAAIQLLNQAGIKVLLVTNQAGVARGIMTEAAVQTLHRELVRLLKRKGAFLDGIYYCPHHPEAGNSPYTQVCQCRKPAPGLIEKASQEHGIDLRRSYVVGDKWSDMELARRVGARGILVLTGDGNQEVHRCIRNGSKAEVVVPDLYEAVQWILRDFSAGGQRDINPTKVTELNLKI